MQELKIKPEFKKLIPPLSEHEKEGLEAEIRYWARCYSPIITWKGYIADGHHRYDICQRHGLPFMTEELNVDNELAVKRWMINNQFRRRNLPMHVRLELALLDEVFEQEEAKKRQGERIDLEKDNISPLVDRGSGGRTIDKIAEKAECGRQTVFEYKKIKEAGLEKRVADGESIKKVYTDLKRQTRLETLKDTEFPSGKYRIIYADPPWDYKTGDNSKNTADPELHYPVMPLEDICGMPIKDLADDNAVLFLWTTSYHIFQSQAVLESWGFTYKSMFIWDKVKHNMGRYNSLRHEILLIATKGSCTPDNVELFDSVQSIERTAHSTKPEEFRKIIETLYQHGNKLELFARKQTEGWEVYGNQVA